MLVGPGESGSLFIETALLLVLQMEKILPFIYTIFYETFCLAGPSENVKLIDFEFYSIGVFLEFGSFQNIKLFMWAY